MREKTHENLALTLPEKHIALITLRNPAKRNALTEKMIEELIQTLKEIDLDDDIRVVVMTGQGKAFSAGGDLKAMKEKRGMFAGDSEELMSRYQRGIQQIPKTIESFGKPLIAMLNGPAVGAGCDLACMCDLRVGNSRAKMGETFAKLGIVPGDGGSFFLQRIVGYAKAMEMLLTARIYEPEACYKMGLLNELVGDEELEEKTFRMAREIAANSQLSMKLSKSALKAARTADLQTQLDMLSAYQGIAQRTDEHFSKL